MGEIVSDFRSDIEVYGEGFYMVDVAVNPPEQLSGLHSIDDIRAAD